MRKIPLAVQTYSVRDEIKKDLPGTLKKIKAMGYDGIEMFGTIDMAPEAFAHMLEEIGLTLCGWHIGLEALEPDAIEGTIAFHRACGNKRPIVPALDEQYCQSHAGYLAAADKLNRAAAVLKAAGMQTGYHNHETEFSPMEGENPWDTIAANTCGDVILQLDNGNAAAGGADTLAYIQKYPGRARTVHLKPYAKATGFDAMIGSDDLPWKDFFAACADVGGTQWYIVEYECEERYSQMEGIQQCMEAMKALRDKGWVLF
nr:sugar phosphate isomerase/epimerase [bacterium]